MTIIFHLRLISFGWGLSLNLVRRLEAHLGVHLPGLCWFTNQMFKKDENIRFTPTISNRTMDQPFRTHGNKGFRLHSIEQGGLMCYICITYTLHILCDTIYCIIYHIYSLSWSFSVMIFALFIEFGQLVTMIMEF